MQHSKGCLDKVPTCRISEANLQICGTTDVGFFALMTTRSAGAQVQAVVVGRSCLSRHGNNFHSRSSPFLVLPNRRCSPGTSIACKLLSIHNCTVSDTFPSGTCNLPRYNLFAWPILPILKLRNILRPSAGDWFENSQHTVISDSVCAERLPACYSVCTNLSPDREDQKRCISQTSHPQRPETPMDVRWAEGLLPFCFFFGSK